MSIQEALECIQTLEARAEFAWAWFDAAGSQDERRSALQAVLGYLEEIERLREEYKL